MHLLNALTPAQRTYARDGCALSGAVEQLPPESGQGMFSDTPVLCVRSGLQCLRTTLRLLESLLDKEPTLAS